MPPTGDCSVGVGESFLERGHLGGRGGDAGPRRVNFLGPGTGAQFRERLFRGPDSALRGGDAIPRQVPSRGRIVALLLRAGVVGEQGFEAREILRRGVELGLRHRELRARGFHLRLGLANVFRAGAGHGEPQLRFGAGHVRAGALNGELHVARVERHHHLPGLDAIAFLDGEREDAATRLRREACLGGLDMTRHSQPVRGGLFGTRDEQREWREGNRECFALLICHF